MNNWYTRKEVAERLGVSHATVYHYAKQGKIIKIEDPHRFIREVRYQRAEVDQLAEERKRNTPTGIRPSALANELDVPTQRIYALIQETDLPVDELQAGDERKIYSIPEETANWMRMEVKRTVAMRGTRVEFYDSEADIALYQRFQNDHGHEVRVIRNEKNEWGFYLQATIWISYKNGIETYGYKPVYKIHQPTMAIKGYTDFVLPTSRLETYDFLDFVYAVWGIENIRLRALDNHFDLSIKSGEREVTEILPGSLTLEKIHEFIVLGNVHVEEGRWHMVSGYRRTTFDLPNHLLNTLQKVAKDNEMTMSEIVEQALKEKLEES